MDDMISRAALLDEMTAGCMPMDAEISGIIGDTCTIRSYIENAPAVDAAPVVRGQWIEKECSENTIEEWQTAKCSNCGKYHTTPYIYYFDNYNYCPNCGAKNTES